MTDITNGSSGPLRLNAINVDMVNGNGGASTGTVEVYTTAPGVSYTNTFACGNLMAV